MGIFHSIISNVYAYEVIREREREKKKKAFLTMLGADVLSPPLDWSSLTAGSDSLMRKNKY